MWWKIILIVIAIIVLWRFFRILVIPGVVIVGLYYLVKYLFS